MPSPNTTSYDRPDIAEAFTEFDAAASEAGFIGLQLAPPFNTPEQSGTFPRVPIEAVLEEVETARNSKGGYAQSDWEFEQDSFATKEHGAEERIDDRQAAIYASVLEFETICAARARWKVLIKLEREIKTALEAAGTQTAVGTAWDQASAATPIDDVLGQIDSFKVGCGYEPSHAWLTDKLLRKLALCSQIQDRVKFSGMDDPKFATDPGRRSEFVSALSALFGIPNIVVASAMRNSANKGATFSGANVWTDSVFGLIRVPSSRDLSEVGAYRTFVWDGDGAGIGGTFETYRNDSVRSDMMRFRHERQVKQLHSVCVRSLTGCTS